MDIEATALGILRENRRVSGIYQYTVPSAEHYPYQWLWDSCFHAIVLARYEPEAAKAELRALLSKQFDNGLVPHIIYWSPGILHLFRWGVEGTSSITQPPMLAYAVWEVHRRAGDRDFLAEVYPALLRYYRFLIDTRDPRDHHLIGVINPDETGEDNSSRFDDPLGAPPDISYKEHHALREALVDQNTKCDFDAEQCMRNYFWVKDVPFNAILVENLRALGYIATLLDHEDGQHFANLHADLIAQAMRTKLYDGDVFWSASGEEYERIPVASWAHFAPLFAGLYTPDEAARVVSRHLRDEATFLAPYGIRTISKKELSYRATGYPDGFSWRGPVWMAPHWFIYRGLVRYGFLEDAEMIREKSRALLEKSGFRECFNPETGEGYGAANFTWGALVLDMQR